MKIVTVLGLICGTDTKVVECLLLFTAYHWRYVYLIKIRTHDYFITLISYLRNFLQLSHPYSKMSSKYRILFIYFCIFVIFFKVIFALVAKIDWEKRKTSFVNVSEKTCSILLWFWNCLTFFWRVNPGEGKTGRRLMTCYRVCVNLCSCTLLYVLCAIYCNHALSCHVSS